MSSHLATPMSTPIEGAPGLSKGARESPTPMEDAPPSPAVDEPSPNPGTPGFPTLSCPASVFATPMGTPPDLSKGARSKATPILRPPPLSHPARLQATPIDGAPGISERPVEPRHPSSNRLLFSPGHTSSDTQGPSAGHFEESRSAPLPISGTLSFGGHTSVDDRTRCAPAFYPGQVALDSQSSHAGSLSTDRRM